MQQTLFTHPRLSAHVRTGSEGPRHDPYSYSELTISNGTTSIVIHEGLAVWMQIKIGDNYDLGKIEPHRTDYDRPRHWFNTTLKQMLGVTIEQVERIARKKRRNCPKGGRHELYDVPGYPGESLDICAKCNRIVDSSFDVSAVI